MLRKIVILVLLLIALLTLYFATGGNIFKKEVTKQTPTPTPKMLDQITLAHGADSVATIIPLIAAREGGFFKKYDLEVKEIAVQKTADALISKSVDVITTGGVGGVLPATIKGGDFIWIAAVTSNNPTVIISKVPKDKIKTVAARSPNSTGHQQLILGLQLIGVNTDKLTVLFMESQQGAFAALEKGDVDAIHIALAEWLTFQKTEAGKTMSVVFDYRDVSVPYFPQSIITRKETIKTKRATLVKLLAALLEGDAYIKTHPDVVKNALMKRFSMEEKEAKERIEVSVGSLKNLTFMPNVESAKKMLSLLAKDIEEAKTYDPEKFIDDTLAKEAISLVDFPKIQKLLNE